MAKLPCHVRHGLRIERAFHREISSILIALPDTIAAAENRLNRRQ